jgi:KDO2-lipid IV(A) lauroyltransferase
VPFFGIDKLTTLIPARLALRHGAELVVVRCLRQGPGRFLVDFFPPVLPDDPDAPVLEQAEQMSAKINGYFESWIRERPGDWFCSKRRWAKDAVAPAPAGS